ncbi:hypothetical protein ABWW58_01490 [Sporolactobacillus sp. STCC-11]|uniref:hypothetical protein n=1 Tax=Sporolactobacillus caesalpiniae TaxID=3230362 RepID=UPI00339ABD56
MNLSIKLQLAFLGAVSSYLYIWQYSSGALVPAVLSILVAGVGIVITAFVPKIKDAVEWTNILAYHRQTLPTKSG